MRPPSSPSTTPRWDRTRRRRRDCARSGSIAARSRIGGGNDVAGHLNEVTGRSDVLWVCQPRFFMISRMSEAVADGVLPTLTPAASRASFLAAAVPDEPDTIAPAWPMVFP